MASVKSISSDFPLRCARTPHHFDNKMFPNCDFARTNRRFFPVHVRLSFHVKKTHQNFWVIYFKPQPDLRPLFKAIFWGHFPYFSPHHLGTLPNRREFGPYNFPSFFWNPWLGRLLGCPKEVRKGLVCGL